MLSLAFLIQLYQTFYVNQMNDFLVQVQGAEIISGKTTEMVFKESIIISKRSIRTWFKSSWTIL